MTTSLDAAGMMSAHSFLAAAGSLSSLRVRHVVSPRATKSGTRTCSEPLGSSSRRYEPTRASAVTSAREGAGGARASGRAGPTGEYGAALVEAGAKTDVRAVGWKEVPARAGMAGRTKGEGREEEVPQRDPDVPLPLALTTAVAVRRPDDASPGSSEPLSTGEGLVERRRREACELEKAVCEKKKKRGTHQLLVRVVRSIALREESAQSSWSRLCGRASRRTRSSDDAWRAETCCGSARRGRGPER